MTTPHIMVAPSPIVGCHSCAGLWDELREATERIRQLEEELSNGSKRSSPNADIHPGAEGFVASKA
jgi:hypothetical protein